MAQNEQATELYIQIKAGSGAVVPQGAAEDFVRATEEKMREVSRLIKTGCKDLISDISSMAHPPAEIEIEFGVDVGAEGSVPFITKGSISANFKVSATWKAAD
jgi:hypothetical protein